MTARYQKLLHVGTLLRAEILSTFKLPEYAVDSAYYDKLCQEQTGWMAITRLASDLERLPRLARFVASIRPLATFSHIQMFVTRPHYVGAWHLDGVDRKAAINIPLFGCDCGGIEWTDTVFESQLIQGKLTSYHEPRATENAVVSDSNLLTHMTVVRTDIWHRINNTANPAHRITASLRFKDNPTFDQLRSELKTHWNAS